MSMYSMFAGGRVGARWVLGIMPHISATIIIQLMTAVVPSLSKLAQKKVAEPSHQHVIFSQRCPVWGRVRGQRAGKILSTGWCLKVIWWWIGGLVSHSHDDDTTTGTVLLMWLANKSLSVESAMASPDTAGIIAWVDQAAGIHHVPP